MASLKYRRLRARGLSPRLARLWANRNFSGLGNRATLLTGTGNAQIYYYDRTPGAAGNSVTIAYVAAGNNTPLSVSVSGTAITVNLATNGSGTPTSTSKDVSRAINFSPTASLLVWAEQPEGSDGTGIVAAQGATGLTGAS